MKRIRGKIKHPIRFIPGSAALAVQPIMALDERAGNKV
jgi:hypothetical protein